MTGSLRVIATAGHVDHGKSALIVALTGIDPDRFAEEKRRGLTIDLGYAWTTLPGGREVGFVDVPGHERFIRNMLAGVGPVRLVLFVVAADEGWKPQSEEHLQILDVLGIAGGVIALTKTDLIDADGVALTIEDVRERVAGTALSGAAIVPVSARTGVGIDALRAELERVVARVPTPEDARARLFVDRVFSITGAGTVVTGTLTGGCLRVEDDVAVEPGGIKARIRALQTHKRDLRQACHVSRAAANLAGVERAPLHRGSIVCLPGAFRPTAVFEAVARPVRGVERIPERGAFTVHSGAGETTARLRVLERRTDGEVLLRIRTDDALVLDMSDRFVLWESGRRRTVGGGIVLDVAPPRAADPRHVAFLARRAAAPDRAAIAALCIEEAGAIRADELAVQLGPAAEPAPPDSWWIDPRVEHAVSEAVVAALRAIHEARPLDEGAPLDDVRAAGAAACGLANAPSDRTLIDALLARLDVAGSIVRDGMTVRLPSHRVALADHEPELDRLVAAISGEHEATPPTVKELAAAGFDPSLIDAAARAGLIVRISPELVLSDDVVARAASFVRNHPTEGVTVSALREHLATSRKYAVPLAEWMDATGISRRVGDLRFPRETP